MIGHTVVYYDDDGNVIDIDIVNDREAAELRQLIVAWSRNITIVPVSGKCDLTKRLLAHVRAGRRAYNVIIPINNSAPEWAGKTPTAKQTTYSNPDDGRPSLSARYKVIQLPVWAETEEGAIARAKEVARAHYSRRYDDGSTSLDIAISDCTYEYQRVLDLNLFRKQVLAAIGLDPLDLGESKGTMVHDD